MPEHDWKRRCHYRCDPKIDGRFRKKNNARINIKLDVPPRKKLKTYEKSVLKIKTTYRKTLMMQRVALRLGMQW